MKKWLLLLALLPVLNVQAGLKLSGDNFQLSSKCVELESGGMKLSSDECASGKNNQGNRSVHGDNNPGKGHKKNKNKDK